MNVTAKGDFIRMQDKIKNDESHPLYANNYRSLKLTKQESQKSQYLEKIDSSLQEFLHLSCSSVSFSFIILEPLV